MATTIPRQAISVERLVEEARNRLKAGGVRTTQPRIEMLQAMARQTGPKSIEAIHGALDRRCDLVTVYRSITAMEEIGLVRKIYAHSGVTLYQLALAPEMYPVLSSDEPEAVLEELDPPPEMRLAIQAVEDALRAGGFTHVSHAVQFYTNSRGDKPEPTGSSER
jgi:Fe2+ or Zn2+ uptake regulation protein